MSTFIFKRGTINDLDLIKSLWEKLNQHHFELSDNFKSSIQNRTWDARKQVLVSKSKDILLDYVEDENHHLIIAYCFSTIDKDVEKTGEIDSLYVDKAYRNSGVGKILMDKAIAWLISKGTETQRLVVGTGNEDILSFYEQFHFYPRSIKLERVVK